MLILFIMKSEMIVTFGGGKKVNAEFNGFTIATDQAIYAGGEGAAPEPFSLFLASIGTCAGIFVLSFCQSRGIPTDVFVHYSDIDAKGYKALKEGDLVEFSIVSVDGGKVKAADVVRLEG